MELNDENATIVCAGMVIYKNTPEQYTALMSIESWKKLQEYKKAWTKKMSRTPTGKDCLILDRTSRKLPLSSKTIKKKKGIN